MSFGDEPVVMSEAERARAAAHLDASTVFVAIPSHDNRVSCATVFGLLETQATLGPDNFGVQAMNAFLPRARDKLTATFLNQTKATHLLFVDGDIAFRAAHVIELLHARKAVVAGMYAKKDGTGALSSCGITGATNGALLECQYAATGFMLITRDTIAKMYDAYPELTYDGIRALFMPKLAPDGFYETEDYAFCARWRALGGRVYLHPRVRLEHIGDTVYRVEASRVVIPGPSEVLRALEE